MYKNDKEKKKGWLLNCKMKILGIFLSLAIFFSHITNAQYQGGDAIFQDSILNAHPSENRNEIGLKIWGVYGVPFSITYKRYCKDNKAFRTGLGFYSNFDKTTKNFYTTYSTNFRIGKEWHKPIHEKFVFYKGVDIIFSHDYYKSKKLKSNDDYSLDNSLSGGVGPLIGLKLLINSRISLSTEIIPTVSVTYSEYRNSSINDNPIFIRPSTGISVDVESVGVIYLHYNF